MLVAAAFTGAQAFINSCSLASLKPVSIGENSFVYAADGSLLGSIPAEQNRQPVALDQMSPLLAQATVAIEDKRFYSHSGVDYEGILRAAVKNIEQGEIVQGGSTLTQQLVRNLYIGREVSWERKTKEACLAIKLEEEGLPKIWGPAPAGLTPTELKRWRKERILETYLNQVYFGSARLRCRGCRADVLLQARIRADARAGGADRRAAAGALDLRPLPAARPGARPPQRRARARCSDSGYISEAAYQATL